MDLENFMTRSCPACKKNKFMGKPICSKKKAEDLTLNTLSKHWNGFYRENIFFSYARCEGCGLLYTPIFFNDSALARLYSEMSPNMDEVPLDVLTFTQYGYFKFLKNVSPMTGSLVEIGPDIGLFTEHCVREGSFDQYWLFEPNKAVKDILERVVLGHKAEVIHEMINFTPVPDGSVSVVVIIHVMDHLLDPVTTLSELRKKLKADARLIIVTHDESSLLRRIFGWKWPAFCLQHPQIYNPKTIKSLLDHAGFDVLEQHKTVNYFKISFLVKHLLWAVGIKVKSVPKFCNMTLGLKLGNILTIATPKESSK